jgi:predicted nucleotide-binding protein
LISLPTPKYHIYIQYAEAEKTGFRFNLTHEELNRTFTEYYSASKPFWFMGRLLNPSKVIKVVIFWSYETADKLKLPNGESLVVCKDKKYQIENILKSKVMGTYLCTEQFVQPTQTPEPQPTGEATAPTPRKRQRLFVVAGKDQLMSQAVTGALTKLFLVPVVLQEEPSQGRRILTNFTSYIDMKFAVVLLSPDDCVYPRDDKTTKSKLKPRQDIIFLLGYLLGKLGMEKVLVLFRESTNFEIPNDFEGIKFVAFDDRGSWKLALVRELTACGYSIEGERILK